MRTVFLDTFGILALIDTSDQGHALAERAMSGLLSPRTHFVTTPLILFECGNAAARTNYRTHIDDLREELKRFGHLIPPTEQEEQAAWAAYRKGESG